MVVVSDLVARVRAEGVQETAQQIKAVGESAQQTARALQIMAESAAKSAPTQGSAAQILELFQKGNVAPTAAALAEAARQMQSTATAATQAVAPAQNVARAAAEHATSARSGAQAAQAVADGWKLSESSVVRFGTAILGINLGISLVAGAARQIHEQILGAVDAARDLEVAGRAAAASYGHAAGSALGAAAGAFAADPSTSGTAAQYTQAVTGMRALSAEYGLNLAQIQQLTSAAGQLARVQGVDLPTAAKALDEVMHGNTSAAESLGIVLTDQSGRLRGIGASYDELATISGRARAEQLLLQTTLQAVQAQQDNTRGSSDNLASAFDRLGKAAEGARARAGSAVAGPAAAVANAAASVLEGRGSTRFIDPSMGYATGSTADHLAQAQANQLEGVHAAQRAIAEERADLIQATSAIQQNTAAVEAQTTAYERNRLAMNQTVDAIGRVRQQQSQFSAIAEAARGPYFPQVLGSARTIGAAQAAQDELALRAQSGVQGQADRMREQMVLGVTAGQEIGPNAAARAQQLLEQYDRRVDARTQQAQAQHDLAINDLNLAQTQAGLTDISLRQRDRELSMQRETIGLRREDLQLQQNVLGASQAVAQARLTALPTQDATSAFGYQQTLAQAYARRRMALLLTGQDVSGEPTLDQDIQMRYQGQIGEALNGVALVQANRGVELAQQGQTAAQLSESLVAGRLQGSQLALDLANLGDLPDQTALLIEQLQLQRDQLQAQQDERDAVRKLVDLSNEPPVAGAGVTTSNTVNINVTGPVSVRSDQDLADLATQVADLVFGGPSAPMTSSELAGARRGPR